MIENNTKKAGGNLFVAIAIVIAALIIGAAIIFTNNDEGSTEPTTQENDFSFVREITEDDYIKGSINAPVKILEFSDTECPFCGRLQTTLNEITAEYGDSVAWVYRHLPLHSKSLTESHATECAAELSGTDEGFWKYIDRLYEISPFNDGLDLAQLDVVAEYADLNVEDFKACMEENRHVSAVREDYDEGIELLKYLANKGVRAGTPVALVMGPDGQIVPITGAQPKNVWQETINALLGTEE